MAKSVKSRYTSWSVNPHIDQETGAVKKGHYEQAQRYEQLYREYKALAKKADQRLVRLEQYSEQEYFHGIKNWAYATAAHDIEAFNEIVGVSQDKPRFNTAAPANIQQLQAKVSSIKKFLELPTSTKKGIVAIYQKRADTTNARYGTEFTWQELAMYYDSGLAEKLDAQFKASATILRALGALKKANLDPEQISSANFKDMKLAKDEVVDELAHKLAKMGFTGKNLFND